MMSDLQDDALEAALRSFGPRGGPPVLAEDGDVQYAVEELAIGRMLVATRTGGPVVSVRFVPDEARLEEAVGRLAGAVSPRVLRGGNGPSAPLRQLEEYLAGRRRAFDLDLDPVLATPFQKVVLERLPRVAGFGRTASYRDLAVAVDRPTASRAVGVALGANPLCVVLPCHRVVSSSGALTGYAGGIEAKRALLELERRG
jgi:methylated-DNA-[protein]-cysteine S-methyltransferase